MSLFNRPLGTPDDLAGFSFKQRHGKINWREIEEIDLERVIQTSDLEALQAILENLTYALLDREDLERISDAKAVKLFKLYQLALEYLLNVQNTLYSQTQQMQTHYTETHQRTTDLQVLVKGQENDIAALTKEISTKKKQLTSYEYMLRQPSTSAAAAQALNRATAVKCPSCSKHFMSKEYLDKHELRRHALRQADLEQEKKPDMAFSAMLDTMKTILSQNIQLVTDSHAREVEALKSAFDRKLQEVEAARQSLEARKLELESAPQTSAVNELVFKELISTQTEMRRILEERDALLLEQMRSTEEQRKRQEELDKVRQENLEVRLKQIVEAQLLAHMPTQRVESAPVRVEERKPIVPEKKLPEVVPEIEKSVPSPTSLQVSIQRQVLRSNAGPLEDDEPSPREVAVLLTPESFSNPIKVLEEEKDLTFKRREQIMAEVGESEQESINLRATGFDLEFLDQEELAGAAKDLGVDLDREARLAFLVRSYAFRTRKEPGLSVKSGLTISYRGTVAKFRGKGLNDTWTNFIRDNEAERPEGLKYQKYTTWFRHANGEMEDIRTALEKEVENRRRRQSRPWQPNGSALEVSRALGALSLQVQRLVRETSPTPKEEEKMTPRAPKEEEKMTPKASKEEIKTPSLKPESKTIPSVPKVDQPPSQFRVLKSVMNFSHLTTGQGFTNRLDQKSLLERGEPVTLGTVTIEGDLLAHGQIGRNDISTMDAEARKERVRLI